MSLPQYNAATEVEVRSVYFTGSDKLKEGYALCFDQDASLTDADPRLRLGVAVEKPATANLNAFAGVVAPDSDGVTGPGFVSIIVPRKGQISKALVKADATAFTTLLKPVDASYALGADGDGFGADTVAKAAQTADTSGTAAVKAVQFV